MDIVQLLDNKTLWLEKLLLKAKVYLVGGCVRDYLLLKPIKDIDILVCGLTIDEIVETLSPYGKIDLVGKQFGILKFKDKTTQIEFDISLPRKEVKTGKGHRGFEVLVDPSFTIEDDLSRRDFLINTLCIDLSNNQLVDKFGGLIDLNDKIIKCVTPKTFIEDPLRILRAIQFASRFMFTIDEETSILMHKHIEDIKELPAERILIELQKGFEKSDPYYFACLLSEYNIFGTLSNGEIEDLKDYELVDVDECKTFGEFLFMITKISIKDSEEWCLKHLKIDNKTYKEIKCLNKLFWDGVSIPENVLPTPILLKQAAKIDGTAITTQLSIIAKIRADMTFYQKQFSDKILPLKVTDLNINGQDAIDIGFRSKQIGNLLEYLHIKVLSGDINNNRNELLQNAHLLSVLKMFA